MNWRNTDIVRLPSMLGFFKKLMIIFICFSYYFQLQDPGRVQLEPWTLSLVFIHYIMSDCLPPMDCSLPVSSVHEISQVRILEWVAISFSSVMNNQELLDYLLLDKNYIS